MARDDRTAGSSSPVPEADEADRFEQDPEGSLDRPGERDPWSPEADVAEQSEPPDTDGPVPDAERVEPVDDEGYEE